MTYIFLFLRIYLFILLFFSFKHRKRTSFISLAMTNVYVYIWMNFDHFQSLINFFFWKCFFEKQWNNYLSLLGQLNNNFILYHLYVPIHSKAFLIQKVFCRYVFFYDQILMLKDGGVPVAETMNGKYSW